MPDIIRDSAFGQIVRYVTKGKYFLYPEEKEDFDTQSYISGNIASASLAQEEKDEEAQSGTTATAAGTTSLAETAAPSTDAFDAVTMTPRHSSRGDEEAPPLEQATSSPIAPTMTKDGTILVDWYRTDDAANPHNWSQKKKAFVAMQVDLYTLAVYTASSIYVSSEIGVMRQFGVGPTKASLGLALYVLGYGIGPLLWAPMAEIPLFGRNVPYITTFAIYLILCVPTALVDNLAGLLVLRFLQGFFGSPCLANGGASMQDLYGLLYLPFPIGIWTAAMFLGPAIGPALSGFSVVAESWRWSLWQILWMASPVFILWLFFLPETSADAILLQRARRLRRRAGQANIRSASEVKRRGVTPRAVFLDAIIKPFQIMFLDPAVMFVNVYMALVYGIYYSFFEAFPLVYGPFYGFNLGEQGVNFVTIVVGVCITISMYFSVYYFVVIPDVLKNGLKSQEEVLKPALLMTFGPPIALFMFGWTATPHVPWIVSVIAIGIYAGTVFVVVNAISTYIPMSYPPYAASLFASNDFCRSAFAFGAILFSRPMFVNLGIGKGSSLLGGLSILGVIGVWLLYFYGASLRKRSKFAVS